MIAGALALVSLAAASAAVPSAPAGEDWSRIYAAGDPSVSAEGDKVFFTWAGTNWTASAKGGEAVPSPEYRNPFPAGDFAKTMREAMGRDTALSPDGRRVAFRFRGDNRWRARFGTVSSQSGEIWIYDSADSSFRRVSRGDCDARSPAWIGDGAVAYVKANRHGTRDVYLCDLASGKEKLLVQGGEWAITALSSSKDGRTLLFRRGVDLWRADLDGKGNPVSEKMLVFRPAPSWKRPSRSRDRFYDPVAWGRGKNGKVWNNDGNGSVSAPTNAESAVFTTGGDLWAIKTSGATNVPVRLRGDTRTHERSARITRDGRHVYYIRDCGDSSEIWRMSRADASRPWHEAGRLHEERLVTGSDFFDRLELSPDESMISWTELEGRLMTMNVSGERKIREVTPRGTYRCWEYAWSPDARWIAVAAADGNRNIDVWVVDMRAAAKGSSNAVNVSDHFGWDGDPEWRADSKALVFRGEWGDGGKRLFKVDIGRNLAKGCASLVKREDEKKERSGLAKGRSIQLPYFKAHQKTILDEYYDLAFRTAFGRMWSRFLGGRSRLVDRARIYRWREAAAHAATWTELHWIMNMAMGEIDASHLEFRSSKTSGKEWPAVKIAKKSNKVRKKIASVDKNRKAVEKATGGKWGYVRLGSTDASAYEGFLNDLYRQGRGREGLVLDIRGNGGGNRADLMLSCLMVPRHGWIDWARARRGYLDDHMGRIQFAGKLVVLIDEGVGSNAEMFAHALKTFGRATLVGRPTGGEVLATETMALLDLGEFRVPQGRWFNEEGVSMENNGAEPDVRVDDTPGEWAKGMDSQLDKAIELAKGFMQQNTKGTK